MIRLAPNGNFAGDCAAAAEDLATWPTDRTTSIEAFSGLQFPTWPMATSGKGQDGNAAVSQRSVPCT